jgi:hypothetical protein
MLVVAAGTYVSAACSSQNILRRSLRLRREGSHLNDTVNFPSPVSEEVAAAGDVDFSHVKHFNGT